MGERTEKRVRSFQSESGEEWTQGKRWERTMSLRKWRKLGPVEHDRRGAEMGLMLNRFSEARLWAGWGHVGFIPRTVGGPWMILTRAVIWWVLHCFLETGLVSLEERWVWMQRIWVGRLCPDLIKAEVDLYSVWPWKWASDSQFLSVQS